MQFKSGAAIYTADGQQVGTLKSVVMSPRDQQITNLVVERGFLFTQEKVLPLNWVAHTNDNGDIVLQTGHHDFDGLPAFEEQHYVSPEAGYNANESGVSDSTNLGSTAVPPALYYTGAPGYYPINYGYTYGGGAAAPGLPRYVTETVQNIPEGTVALSINANVFTRDDHNVGKVDEVFTDDQGNATHFVISKGLLFTTRKLIPTDWIDRVESDGVRLSVNRDLLDRLGDYDAQSRSERS